MKRITKLPPEYVFVFGSNEEGVHGRGAALDAVRYFGAKRGVGWGLQGQSFAIPTKKTWRSDGLPLNAIQRYVGVFLYVARNLPELTFHVTPIGCGLAGHSAKDIAPMFKGATDNVILPEEFL